MTNLQTYSNAHQLHSLANSEYHELRGVAGALLRFESPANTMEASDLLHDAILRLLKARTPVQFNNWDHLRRTTISSMRRTLVDHGRARQTKKRAHLDLVIDDAAIHESGSVSGPARETVVVLDRDLLTLGRFGARLKRVVELKVFSGCTISEIAAELKICNRTVRRDWKKACEILAATRK